MALGAAEAVAGAGLDVPIIGFDALPEALQAIQDGTLTATVDQWPGRQTSGAMEILVNYLRDGTEPAEHTTLIEPGLITVDNLGEAERAEEAGITPAGHPEAAGHPSGLSWLDSPSVQPFSHPSPGSSRERGQGVRASGTPNLVANPTATTLQQCIPTRRRHAAAAGRR